MNREEQLERKRNNIQKKGERVLETARLFLELNGDISDIDLAKKLNEKGIETSSSTVGRDLTINLRKYYIYQNRTSSTISNIKEDEIILTEEQESIINFISNKRTSNKYDGKVKGGINSSIKNEYVRDEKNHFKGSIPRV